MNGIYIYIYITVFIECAKIHASYNKALAHSYQESLCVQLEGYV
jgi:hypothetical protein